MRKVFIILSGIYLAGLGALSGLFLTLGFFVTQREAGQMQGINTISVLAVNLLLAALLVITGICIILRKNWARYAVFILSGLAVFTGIILCIVAVFMPIPADTPGAAQISPDAKIGLLIFSLVFLFAVPIFFFVFFSKGSVKELFISKEKTQAAQIKRPVGITVVAVLMLFGALSSAAQVLFPSYAKMPIVDGIFVSGMLAKGYFLVFTIISLYIAIGLFRLKKNAWIAYVAMSLYAIIVGAINVFTFTKATLIEMMPQMAESAYSMPDAVYKFFTALSVLFSAILLAYIYSKKRLFFETET